ncbi:MAG: putative sugar nucleotidyl transferase [Rhodothermales bacterium]
MYLCLFEDDQIDHLLPLVATRAVYDLRLGIRTLLETTREAFAAPPTLLHARSLIAPVTAQENNLPANRIPHDADVLFVNGRLIAEDGPLLERLRRAARNGEPARVFVQDEEVVAAWVPRARDGLVQAEAVARATFEGLPEETVEGARLVDRLWHLIDALRPALLRDFAARTAGRSLQDRTGAGIHESAVLIEEERIYVAPGATLRPGVILNAEGGPIFIDEHATVMEHAVVKGPVYVGPGTHIKVAANIEGSAIGERSKVGGEVHDSLVHSFSNKAHVGFLGHSYLGRWCNLGAGTNTSNLKNDYGPITLFDAATGAFDPTGRQFLGLFMGDHSKCGINATFNTGTVVGVFCNIYGAGLPPRTLPSFSWGSAATGFVEYRLDKALRVAETVMARRQKHLTDAERIALTALFEARKEAGR